jgi:hypothetical protein
MEVVRGIIRYHLPEQGAQYYADGALRVLGDLEKHAPITLPTFLSSNSILTLSGVRAFDAYHEFYDYIDGNQAASATKILKQHGIYLEYGNRLFSMHQSGSSRVFELLNEGAFRELWDTYEFPVGVECRAVSLKFPYDAVHTTAWLETVDNELASAMNNDLLPRAWLNDWYAPFNIRFGMMLGYPAKAIESILWEAIGLQHESNAYATIQHHDAYYAAQPIYSFAKSLAKDPEIVAHQTLWSDVLDRVYSSPWHTQVKHSAAFKEAMGSLKKFEEK